MRKRRMRYHPSKSQCIFGGILGIFFVIFGIAVALPTFGIFGLIWTGAAVFITVSNFLMAAGKKNALGTYVIEEIDPAGEEEKKSSAEERLLELQRLYDRRLITAEEYEAKRQEILKEI